MLGCFFQLIPAMNPATVAGIGSFIGPFWPDSHQTEDDQAHIEGKLSIRQVERTVEKDSVIQNFRITAAETKRLGEGDAKARSRKTIRKSQMVPVIRWLRITQPAENKAVFRQSCIRGVSILSSQTDTQGPRPGPRGTKLGPIWHQFQSVDFMKETPISKGLTTAGRKRRRHQVGTKSADAPKRSGAPATVSKMEIVGDRALPRIPGTQGSTEYRL